MLKKLSLALGLALGVSAATAGGAHADLISIVESSEGTLQVTLTTDSGSIYSVPSLQAGPEAFEAHFNGLPLLFSGGSVVIWSEPDTSRTFNGVQPVSSTAFFYGSDLAFSGSLTPHANGFVITHWQTNVDNGHSIDISFTETAPGSVTGTVPEPASMALLGAGLAGLGFVRRRPAGRG